MSLLCKAVCFFSFLFFSPSFLILRSSLFLFLLLFFYFFFFFLFFFLFPFSFYLFSSFLYSCFSSFSFSLLLSLHSLCTADNYGTTYIIISCFFSLYVIQYLLLDVAYVHYSQVLSFPFFLNLCEFHPFVSSRPTFDKVIIIFVFSLRCSCLLSFSVSVSFSFSLSIFLSFHCSIAS